MQIKKELRKELKSKRKNLEKKAQSDEFIRENLICSDLYLESKQVLFYAGLDDEINLDECINDALLLSKKAALPVCTDDSGNMEFYYINAMNDLKSGFFGVREPDINKCEKVTDFSDSICIVPAIAYDKSGYRLGYGKGYYDRFLKNNTLISVGVCYNELIEEDLPRDEYDIPVNYIITQSGLIVV